jgi:tetratricopeptide (TPR) repeat protein
VIDAINPKEGGVALFQKVWQTTCGGFKNESQNYSQIALASLLNFDQLISQNMDTVYLIKGDYMARGYNRKKLSPVDAYQYLTQCMRSYESDFIDEMIPYDYFMKRISSIRKELSVIANTVADRDMVLKKYPASEAHIAQLASELSKRQRYEDAIRMLKLNLDIYPTSVTSYDNISRLYRLTGDRKNADLYSTRSGSEAKATD